MRNSFDCCPLFFSLVFLQPSDLYLAITKNGVVDHDSVHSSVLVGLDDLVLEIVSGASSELKLDTGLSAGLCSPLGILCGGGILVGEETDQLWADVAALDRVLELLSGK